MCLFLLLLFLCRLACNDVYAMLTTYGVEAARATILKEVQVGGTLGLSIVVAFMGLPDTKSLGQSQS